MVFVLLANRLSDGAVVYLADQGSWTEVLGQAQQFESEDDQAQALVVGEHSVASNIVVGAELVPLENGTPMRLRENIRAIGPTVRPDLARAHQ